MNLSQQEALQVIIIQSILSINQLRLLKVLTLGVEEVIFLGSNSAQTASIVKNALFIVTTSDVFYSDNYT